MQNIKTLEDMLPQEAEECIAKRTGEIGGNTEELYKFFCTASSAAMAKKWDSQRISALVAAIEEHDVRQAAPKLLEYLKATDRINRTTCTAIRMLGRWKYEDAADFMQKALAPLQHYYMHENAYAGSKSLYHGNPEELRVYWAQIDALQTALEDLGHPAEHKISRDSKFSYR